MSDPPGVAPAGWHPDPLERHELRYWDGSTWTDHVSDAGVTSKDPVTPKKSLFARIEDAVTIGDHESESAKEQVRGQVDGGGLFGTGVQARTEQGGGSLFTERVLVVKEVARITKTFEGIIRTAFTTADKYVVQIHQDIPEPLHSLVIASAVSVDTALKQDDRGFN